MEEKVIEGKFIKFFIIFPVAFTIISLFVLFVIIPDAAGFNSFEFDFCLPTLSVLVIVSWIIFFYANNCALTITNKRVCGTAAFGQKVDLPIDSVSAIKTTWLSGLVISTSSGKIAFLLVSNRKAVYECVCNLLILRQSSTVAQPVVDSKVPISSADELKKYKDLLDSGVITQEEFDAKKKQLLGL